MERQINFPRFSFTFCFRNDHVEQAQATTAGHTYEKKVKSQRFSLAFAFVIKKSENPKSWDFHIFACNCFCADDIDQEPLNAPFLNGLFSKGFSRGKTDPYDDIREKPH